MIHALAPKISFFQPLYHKTTFYVKSCTNCSQIFSRDFHNFLNILNILNILILNYQKEVSHIEGYWKANPVYRKRIQRRISKTYKK